MKRFNESWDYAKDNWHAKWDRDNKHYDSERAEAQYQGTTDTFIPLPFSTVETMTSALNNADLRFDYTSGDPMKRVDTRPLNALVDEWAEDDGWDLSFEESYRETFIVGMDGNMLTWEGDHPHLESYAMRDIIIDPTVRNPAELQKPGRYAGRRFFVRKGDLDDIEVLDSDPKSNTFGEMIPRYKKEDGTSKGQQEPTDKELKEMFSGSVLNKPNDNQDEIIEIWDIDRVVTIKNRCYVIEDVVNPHKARHEFLLTQQYLQGVDEPDELAVKEATDKAKAEAKGLNPFFFRNYRRKSLMYAKGELDSIHKEVERLNDMTNMETDNLIKHVAPQKELDPEYEDWQDLIDDDPGTVYPFKPGSLQDRQPPSLPANAFANRQDAKNDIREATAIDQLAKGVQNVKDTTATEVQAQLQQTGQRIQSKARIFKKDAFYWMGFILMRLVQLYVDEPLVVKVPGATVNKEEVFAKYGIELPQGTAIFDPADYVGEWRPRVVLEVDGEHKQSEERRIARENYQILIQDPTNNLEEAKKILYPKMFDMDKDDLAAIMTPAVAPEMPMGSEGALPPEMGAPSAQLPAPAGAPGV
ncbi:portal protein [Arthrobacter cavernae]|uniref:Portal protein n=1 Tax=Arthrobacter cavernae TaxID=2817681 RepID=A0A939HGU6_9MICC|nr:hypothetical protein [Arthrobacter cavernae]MBO1267083.1 hypothetical protein [Arthrobacter cavernae]